MLSNFDPGGYAEYILNPDHTSHFLALLLTFQFHRALCIETGQYSPIKADIKPLYKCDLYGSEIVSNKLKQIMSLGGSQPWSKLVKMITGDTTIRVDAIMDYFKPLHKLLNSQRNTPNDFKLTQKRRRKRKRKSREDKRKRNFERDDEEIKPVENYVKSIEKPNQTDEAFSFTSVFSDMNTKNVIYISCAIGLFILTTAIAFSIYYCCSVSKKKKRYGYDSYANTNFPFITYPIMNRTGITRRVAVFFDRLHRMFIDPEK